MESDTRTSKYMRAFTTRFTFFEYREKIQIIVFAHIDPQQMLTVRIVGARLFAVPARVAARGRRRGRCGGGGGHISDSVVQRRRRRRGGHRVGRCAHIGAVAAAIRGAVPVVATGRQRLGWRIAAQRRVAHLIYGKRDGKCYLLYHIQGVPYTSRR